MQEKFELAFFMLSAKLNPKEGESNGKSIYVKLAAYRETETEFALASGHS